MSDASMARHERYWATSSGAGTTRSGSTTSAVATPRKRRPNRARREWHTTIGSRASGNNLIDAPSPTSRSEEHTSELQSHSDLVCRLLLEKKKKKRKNEYINKQEK